VLIFNQREQESHSIALERFQATTEQRNSKWAAAYLWMCGEKLIWPLTVGVDFFRELAPAFAYQI
jgi:hypothetical protein